MGKGSKAPAAPNYTAIAQQQQQLGQQAWSTALNANRPNQTNQFGSLTWEQDPTTGQWTQSSQLNQPQQDIFNQQQANQQQIANMAGGMLGGFDTSQVDFSKLGAMPTVGGYNQQAIDTMRALQAPQLQQQRNAAEAKLAAMGMNTGSGKAWENAQRAIGTNESQADLQAIQAGISQGNTEYNQAMAGRQQGVNEILGQKQANLGQISGMMGLGQQMGVPQFNSFQGMQPYNVADLTGAAQNQYQAQLDQYNAKKASSGGLLGTIGGIAGSFLGPVGSAIGSKIGGA
jgi:hypothetical protein